MFMLQISDRNEDEKGKRKENMEGITFSFLVKNVNELIV